MIKQNYIWIKLSQDIHDWKINFLICLAISALKAQLEPNIWWKVRREVHRHFSHQKCLKLSPCFREEIVRIFEQPYEEPAGLLDYIPVHLECPRTYPYFHKRFYAIRQIIMVFYCTWNWHSNLWNEFKAESLQLTEQKAIPLHLKGNNKTLFLQIRKVIKLKHTFGMEQQQPVS